MQHSEERLLADAGPIKYADQTLRDDPAFMYHVVGVAGRSLLYASDAIRDDYDIAMTAVRSNGGALEYVSDRLRADLGIVQAAVRENRLAVRFADPALLLWMATDAECAGAAPEGAAPEA
jgi:hypothetical protein